MNFNQKEILPKDVVSGAEIKQRYIKCPHMDKNCLWRMSKEHIKGFEYLNNACYLSGSFTLQCPV